MMDTPKKTINHGRCLCGRMGRPMRTLERKTIFLRAPFCPEYTTDAFTVRCRPLSPEEQAQPGIRAFFTQCPPYDKLDFGIQSTIRYLHEHGVQTLSSCDGHLEKPPYVLFYDEDSARRAEKLLGYMKPVFKVCLNRFPILPVVYELSFPQVLADALAKKGG